ncbi:chorismate mutase [Aldersonia sp. NBC_00410]|uniref:chorismate mutase n=1 Tax=Aldersonia sp. NBC_00410 TaxID=2975954 RepID=UPI002258DE9A|nr:chorismate mutase [Aldersonia sp. NBC_00410]MCX5043238.1 chorismate mutase [Aldersonia sp. NBC_00410]
MMETAQPTAIRADSDGDDLRTAIDEIDAEIVALVRRRTELTRAAGLARLNIGLPRTAQHSEMGAVRRYESALGREGVGLAILLMRLGRTGVSDLVSQEYRSA